MLILLGFAFLAGLVTVLAPCIWPILPVVLSSSVSGQGTRRPFGVTVGIMASFAIFTLSISSLVNIFHFAPETLRTVAIVVIAAMGITMAVPRLSQVLEVWISRLSSSFGGGGKEGSGFLGGFVAGASLGLVWSPCAGPILAAIATLASTGRVTFEAVLVTVSYVSGVGVPLFFIAYGGRQLITRTRILSRYTGRIQQAFGVVMVLTAVAIFTSYDTILEAKLLNTFPQIGQTLNSFESNKEVSTQLRILKGGQPVTEGSAIVNEVLFNAETASPEITGITEWLNTSSSLSLRALKGKVVLIDFWTYTCINCIRTLPHVESWYETFKDDGFVVIGVHTPEFQFEHETKNVLEAIRRYHITYPVAQDNNYQTWNAFNNEYWPAEYLIDASGKVRRTHFGEGDYDEMESAIRELLKENGHTPSAAHAPMSSQIPMDVRSPETYLGAERMEYYSDGGRVGEGTRDFVLSDHLRRNSFSFGGDWNVKGEYAVASKDATLNLRFHASKVFLVLRPGNSQSHHVVTVLLDGKPVDGSSAGLDVSGGMVAVDTDRLYNLIDLKSKAGDHVLLLHFDTPGVEAFAFTFG